MINIYFTHALFLHEKSRFGSAWYHSTPQIIIGPSHDSLQCFVAGNVRALSQRTAVTLPSEITDWNTINSHF